MRWFADAAKLAKVLTLAPYSTCKGSLCASKHLPRKRGALWLLNCGHVYYDRHGVSVTKVKAHIFFIRVASRNWGSR